MKKSGFSSELLLKVKGAHNIVDLIGEHVVLRKTGSQYSGLCPFHSERTPSFSVSETKQLYHCYGCHRGGDIISFVMEMGGASFPEAIAELADRARISIADSGDQRQINGATSAKRAKVNLSYKLNRFVAAYYHHHLKSTPAAKAYFSKRGVQDEVIQSFYLGAAEDSWFGLENYLSTKKAPVDLALELGLLRKARNGHSDLFRNRVIFPILNRFGKVAGFGGRFLGEGDDPKYLNSPESLIFQKSKLAFGLYQAQKYIRETRTVILVEGYFDVLALHAAGFRHTVASCGTALTLDHIQQLRRLADRIVLLFDGDSAGKAATARAMEVALESGCVVYGAELPGGLDPDELLWDSERAVAKKDGVEKMNEIVGAARPLLDVAIEEALLLASDGPEAKSNAVKKIGHWLGRFADPVGREVRLQMVQKKMGIPRNLLDSATGQGGGRKKDAATQKISISPAKTSVNRKPPIKMSRVDRVLLEGLIYGDVFANTFFATGDNLPPGIKYSDLFEYQPAKDFIASLLSQPELLERLRAVPDRLFHEELDSEVRAEITKALLSVEPPVTHSEFRVSLMRSLVQCWNRVSKRIKQAIADAELKKDAAMQDQLMKEYLDVQHKMKEFKNFYDEA